MVSVGTLAGVGLHWVFLGDWPGRLGRTRFRSSRPGRKGRLRSVLLDQVIGEVVGRSEAVRRDADCLFVQEGQELEAP